MNGLTKTAAESRRKILEALEGPGPFLISFHGKPDGDALGSGLAIKLWLEARGKRAEVVNSDGVPEPFGFLPAAGRVLLDTPPDVLGCTAFVLDTPGASRAALAEGVLARASLVVNIDHHPDNTSFGDVNLVDPSASSVARSGGWRFRTTPTRPRLDPVSAEKSRRRARRGGTAARSSRS